LSSRKSESGGRSSGCKGALDFLGLLNGQKVPPEFESLLACRNEEWLCLLYGGVVASPSGEVFACEERRGAFEPFHGQKLRRGIEEDSSRVPDVAHVDERLLPFLLTDP